MSGREYSPSPRVCYTVRLSRLFRYCLRLDGAQGRLSLPPFPVVGCCLYCARGERCPAKKKTVGPFRCPVSRAQCHEKKNYFNSSSFYRGQFSLFTPTALLLSSMCVVCGEKLASSFLLLSVCLLCVPSVSCLIFWRM